jgi:Tol biopolymer transport system component
MQPGDIVSHYRIEKRLGSGGMGIVYLAEDLSLHRRVALKFLPPHLSADDSALSRFRREAVAASSLEHPSICTIYEIGHADETGAVFIAMAYYEGQTLREFMNSRSVPVDLATSIVRQAADGLAAAHAKGVIHRDVKPENILITDSGRVVLLDFGVAKLSGCNPLTVEGTSPGTIGYMAPEQARGDAVDASTDQWALGVVLFEMLAGSPPFRGDYEQAVIYSILNEDPIGLVEVDERIQRVVSRALSKDKAQRYGTITEFAEALGRAMGGTDGVDSDAAKPPSRAKTILILAAMFSLLATGIVWRVYGPGRPDAEATISQIGASTATFSQVTFASELEEFPAFSPDATRILFSREEDGYRHIFVRDLATGSENRYTSDSRDDIQAAWSPDGSSIVFVRANSASGKIEPGDIFGTYSGGDIWKLDVPSGRARRIIEEGFNPSFSADGKSIVFDAAWASSSQRLWMVDSEGRNPQQITSDASEDIDHVRPRLSADGKRVVFQSQRRTKVDIEVIDLESRETISITDDAYQNVNPVFVAGVNGIAFSSDRSGGMNIWFVPLTDLGAPASEPLQISTGAGSDVEISASPSTSQLVYSVLGINADLWKLPLDPRTGYARGAPEEVIASTREDSRGSWSAGDSLIAFNSDRTGEMNIWLYRVSDGFTRQLTSGRGGDYQPFWSPDNASIVFFSAREGSPDIWTVDVATGELAQLTDSPSVEVNPCYSPDGAHIAFLSDRGGRREVWLMNQDGSDQRPLTSSGAEGHFLRWMPDGERIVFTADGFAKTVRLHGSEPEILVDVAGGWHLSFSPSHSLIADVVGHKVVWISPTEGSEPFVAFGSEDLDVRIDYPVWSTDGQWLLFDRVKPQGGDIWIVDLVTSNTM